MLCDQTLNPSRDGFTGGGGGGEVLIILAQVQY